MKLPENITNRLDQIEYPVSFRETSFLGLKPGDIILFDYNDGTSRFGIVVRSKRTQSGYFLSTQNNTLLNVYLLDSLSDFMFKVSVDILYKNRIRCTYKNTPKVLGAFLGALNFRTFNVTRIRNIVSLNISR